MIQCVLPSSSSTLDGSSTVELMHIKDMEGTWTGLTYSRYLHRGQEIDKPCANWIYDMATTSLDRVKRMWSFPLGP
jgi:poly(3-hydroxybutyrate) depolymerase